MAQWHCSTLGRTVCAIIAFLQFASKDDEKVVVEFLVS